MKVPKNSFASILIIIASVLLSTALIYLPFALKLFPLVGFSLPDANFQYVYRNFDGLLYIIPAKTWYNPNLIQQLPIEVTVSPIYFAAHLPLYPVFIAVFAPIMGFLKSMLFVNILSTILLAIFLYFFLKKFNLTKNPLVLSIVFLFLPRFLVVRSVGAPESLFILLILMSIFFFEEKKFFFAGLFGGLAVMTKTPGLLLIFGYALVIIETLVKKKTFNPRTLFLLLIPAGLAVVGWLYQVQYGDFFAYFHTGGVVPMPYPYSAFNYQAKWVGTAWLEDILFYFFLYGLAIFYLKDTKYRSLFYFPLVFLVASMFVQHRDLSRYMLPLWPFACIAFEKLFTSKRFIFILLLLLPAIYLYAWNFMLTNVMPVGDWKAFL